MKNFHLRIGDIEIRPCVNSCDYEVIKWSPNPLYGKKDEYRVETPLGEVTYERNGVTYSESCFNHPESCYVVSFVRWDKADPGWCVKEVGTRPFNLEDADYEDWCKLMRILFTADMLPYDEEGF